MVPASLFGVSLVLAAFAVLVWRASPDRAINRAFTTFTMAGSVWVMGVAGVHAGAHMAVAVAVAWAAASIVPVAFLAFISNCPPASVTLPRPIFAVCGVFGVCLSVITLTTDLVVHSPTLVGGTLLSRKAGPLSPIHAAHMMFTWGTALFLFVVKWRAARGRARGELNYLGIGIFIPGGCALATNLVYPLLTGRSTYSWIGPYFSLSFVGIVGHAIIRRHVSDLRLIVHRSLSIAIAAVFASIPLILLLWAVWPRLFGHLEPSEVSLVLISICVISVALPLAGQAGAHAVDRYLYRTRADYHRTIREASSALTRVLDVDTLFKLITDTVSSSIESEAVAVYVRDS